MERFVLCRNSNNNYSTDGTGERKVKYYLFTTVRDVNGAGNANAPSRTELTVDMAAPHSLWRFQG